MKIIAITPSSSPSTGPSSLTFLFLPVWISLNSVGLLPQNQSPVGPRQIAPDTLCRGNSIRTSIFLCLCRLTWTEPFRGESMDCSPESGQQDGDCQSGGDEKASQRADDNPEFGDGVGTISETILALARSTVRSAHHAKVCSLRKSAYSRISRVINTDDHSEGCPSAGTPYISVRQHSRRLIRVMEVNVANITLRTTAEWAWAAVIRACCAASSWALRVSASYEKHQPSRSVLRRSRAHVIPVHSCTRLLQ